MSVAQHMKPSGGCPVAHAPLSSSKCERVPLPNQAGPEALRQDLLSFYDQHNESLCDLIFQLDDGQAVFAHYALVEARLHSLLASAQPVREANTMELLVDGPHSPGKVRQVRLHSLSGTTLKALLRWAYGEAVPSITTRRCGKDTDEQCQDRDEGEGTIGDSTCQSLSLEESVELLEACATHDIERLGALLRQAMLENLQVEDLASFAMMLRESHVRRLQELKQGCKRFALYHFDEIVEQPHTLIATLQEYPELVSELFQLSRQHYERDQSGRGSSPRPAPAPPSTYLADFERLFEAARQAEERGRSHVSVSDKDEAEVDAETPRSKSELMPDCRIAIGQDIFLGHSALLMARSDFFAAAFSADMAERHSLVVTLQHVAKEDSSHQSVLALLHFLYTGKTCRVTEENALSVLALLGSDDALDGGMCVKGGYLQIRDAISLRLACEEALERSAVKDADFVQLLAHAHFLGASRLKQRALEQVVHNFKELALGGAFASLCQELLQEVIHKVALEYDDALPSPARDELWELSTLPTPDPRFQNSYDALISPDLSCGAGASGAAGCSEASLVASFSRLVRVRSVRIGVDLSTADFDAAGLNGSKLQYLASSGLWQDAGVTISVNDGLVQEICLPKPLVAKAFRLVRRRRLAVGLLSFA